MELRRFIFPALCLAVLAGVFLLGYQFSTFESEGLSPTRSLLAAIQSSPWRWGYALASGVMLLAFLIWVPSQFAEWRMLHRFRHIDSAVLDNDCELCQRFYHSLLELRRRYGETRFMQRIAGRFNFFYHYPADCVMAVACPVLPSGAMKPFTCLPGWTGLKYGPPLPAPLFVSMNGIHCGWYRNKTKCNTQVSSWAARKKIYKNGGNWNCVLPI
ncbi:MAG: hypothetical protein P8047_03790 [Gammaproteobacteria bacterium]